jgi:GntR family transcriptional regulator, galactonate operon transcriptional repressor
MADTETGSGYYPRRGLHGRLVDSLGRAIVTGEYTPGDPLDVAALQAERAVSKTALREALRVLAGKGLVDARQKRGTIVAPVGAWNLLDPDVLRWQIGAQAGADLLEALAEVRAIVEPSAARLAAERRTEGDLEALERALATMVGSAADPVAHAAADVAFHRALLRASGNELLGRIGGVLEAVLRARDELVHRVGHRDDFRAPHAAVLAAIRERRPQRAHDAMGELLAKSRADALAAASAGTERLGAGA